MGVNGSIIELEYRIKEHRHTIEALTSVQSQIEDELKTERSLLFDSRLELINVYVDDDEIGNEIVNLDPESPIDLVESVVEIAGQDPPVSVVKELLFDYDFDESDLLELRRSDEFEIIDMSPGNDLNVETFHMPDK
jgi:hypothetical protein